MGVIKYKVIEKGNRYRKKRCWSAADFVSLGIVILIALCVLFSVIINIIK